MITPRPETWPETGLHAAWLGHSTVLLRMEGTWIITDPVFSSRIGVNLGPITLGIKRLMPPALAASQIPRPDLIISSHAHMDHLDLPSMRSLEDRRTTVVMASKTSDLVRRRRYARVHELEWGGSVQSGGVKVSAFEVNHWGARMRTDNYRGYNGYLLEAGRYRVLFGGDTAMTSAFRALKSARAIDLAIMPIGAYDPWIRYHCTPEQAWQMGNDAGAQVFMPVHHQTFQLSREPFTEPIERFRQAAGPDQDRIAGTGNGGGFHLV